MRVWELILKDLDLQYIQPKGFQFRLQNEASQSVIFPFLVFFSIINEAIYMLMSDLNKKNEKISLTAPFRPML